MSKGHKGKKQPTTGDIKPSGEKRPWRIDPQISGGPLAWRFSACDRNGPFGWAMLRPHEKHHDVIERLHEFETKNMEELKRTGSHPIPIGRLSKEAKDRLSAIERDDIDELMSFRCAGTERVWCVQESNIMKVLWWDPDHKVYPVEKDRADREKRRIKEGR